MTSEWQYYVSIDSLDIDDEREDPADVSDAMQGLIDSIKAVGLLQPIVVARLDDGRFRVVCGRRRVRALQHLGHTAVPAVVHQLDEVRREMATITENLHRLELTLAERDAALLRYTQYHEALYPGTLERMKQRKLAALANATPEAKEVLQEPAPETSILAAAKAFGIGRGTVAKAVKRARTFTDEQRMVLDEADIPSAKLDQLAKETPEIITGVVNLIGAGFSFEESLSDVLADHGRVYEKTNEEAQGSEAYLSKMAARRQIRDTEAFDNDVKLYRAIADEVKVFLKKVNWKFIRDTAGKNPYGLYYNRLRLLAETPNPAHWVPCQECRGGKSGNEENCGYCRGGAYQIG